ncbi:aquaporin [Streptomyces sp. NPDC026673]|uniref:MIP/aquaporin family protein n=1 Tax=Streptomyces sp. NPDC026673 TaxID=3155724 RepID=UPI0033DECF59
MGLADASARAPDGGWCPWLPDAAREFALTTVLIFCVVTGVRWLVAPDSAVAVGDAAAAAAANGLLVGLVLVVLITSPPGRRSGAHLNPAISVALWLMGAFPGRMVTPYVCAQLAGSVAGTALGRLVWGSVLSRLPVNYAAVRPRASWSTLVLAGTECGCLLIVVLTVGFFLAHTALSRWLPYIVGALTASIVTVLSRYSGASANPSRQFGPALLAGETRLLWVYLLAPLLGAVLGAGVHRLFQHCLHIRRPEGYRLCGQDKAGA